MGEDTDKELETKNTEDTKEGENKTEDTKKESKSESKKEDSFDIEAWKKAMVEEVTEKVRKEEKDKLYPSIEKHKEDVTKAEDERDEALKRLKEYEEKNLSADEKTQLKFKELEDSNTELKGQLEEIINTANSSIASLKLELTKKDVLNKYGSEIISSMVTGSSEEEIIENAEKAHAEYLAIKNAALAEAKEASKKKDQVGTGIGPSSEKLGSSPTIQDIKNIEDPKEWEKVKNKVLSDLGL